MEENYIRKQIELLRKKQKIRQEDLCFGLCEQCVLSRIENGITTPNYFLETALLSRLGYSSDRMEFILEEQDYKRFIDRNEIEESIREMDYEKAFSLLNGFEKKLEPEENLHLQFLLFCRAKIASNKGELEEALEYAIKALNQTMPEDFFTNQTTEIPFSIIEIELIAKIIELSYQLEKIPNFDLEEILRKLFLQREKLIEEEEKVIVFSNITLQYGTILLKKKKYEEVIEVCDKGIDILKHNARLFNYAELLLLKIEALRKLKVTIELYKETFFMAYSMFGLYEKQKEKQKQIKKYMEEYGWEFTI